MRFDFDEVIDCRGTSSLKWDTSDRSTGVADALPLWVADMDFRPPPAVVEAVRRRAERGVYGYTVRPEACDRAFIEWLRRRHGWAIEREWTCFTPGVVPALYIAVQAFTDPGDRVLIQSPVYEPFSGAVVNTGRQLVNNALRERDLVYEIDVDALERTIDARTKLLIFCSPHNPVGRVWRRSELERLAEVALRHRIVVLSDEIHADLVMPGHVHTPLAALSAEIAALTVTCMAPGKTFNIAGLQMGSAIIPDPSLRRRFADAARRTGHQMPNTFGVVAATAAYEQGQEWLEQVLDYLHRNYQYLSDFIDRRLPRVRVAPLEGTYLAWVDFRACGIPDDDLKRLLLERARVRLSAGPYFGPGGEGFQRINIACPRSVLADALERIAAALA